MQEKPYGVCLIFPLETPALHKLWSAEIVPPGRRPPQPAGRDTVVPLVATTDTYTNIVSPHLFPNPGSDVSGDFSTSPRKAAVLTG